MQHKQVTTDRFMVDAKVPKDMPLEVSQVGDEVHVLAPKNTKVIQKADAAIVETGIPSSSAHATAGSPIVTTTAVRHVPANDGHHIPEATTTVHQAVHPVSHTDGSKPHPHAGNLQQKAKESVVRGTEKIDASLNQTREGNTKSRSGSFQKKVTGLVLKAADKVDIAVDKLAAKEHSGQTQEKVKGTILKTTDKVDDACQQKKSAHAVPAHTHEKSLLVVDEVTGEGALVVEKTHCEGTTKAEASKEKVKGLAQQGNAKVRETMQKDNQKDHQTTSKAQVKVQSAVHTATDKVRNALQKEHTHTESDTHKTGHTQEKIKGTIQTGTAKVRGAMQKNHSDTHAHTHEQKPSVQDKVKGAVHTSTEKVKGAVHKDHNTSDDSHKPSTQDKLKGAVLSGTEKVRGAVAHKNHETKKEGVKIEQKDTYVKSTSQPARVKAAHTKKTTTLVS